MTEKRVTQLTKEYEHKIPLLKKEKVTLPVPDEASQRTTSVRGERNLRNPFGNAAFRLS